jgi:hypothetical protein
MCSTLEHRNVDSFLAFFGEENVERKMYPLCVVKKDYVVVWVKGLMRLSRGAKVLWEKFESGEEADTEIQQQRDHVVIIVQEASYRQGAVDIGEKQDSGRGDAG